MAPRTDPCFRTNRDLRIGVARLLWCIDSFVGRVSECYANFACRLRDAGGTWGVVSFNWDILVERALSQVGATWSYSSSETAVQVIKPHGSINWRSFARNSSETAGDTSWRAISKGSTLSYDLDHPLENPDLHDINPNLRYCMYPGDPDEPSANADLALLWKQARALIARSRRVVFLGYSLPPYDAYAARALIAASKSKNVLVYDPGEQTLARYAKTFPKAQLHDLIFRNTPFARPLSAS